MRPSIIYMKMFISLHEGDNCIIALKPFIFPHLIDDDWLTLNAVSTFRRTIMKNAVQDTRALVVTAQDNMLEKLQHSEVSVLYLVIFE